MTSTIAGARSTHLELAAFFAGTLPFLVAFSLSPMVTLFNQVTAVGGWGLFAMALASSATTHPRSRPAGPAWAQRALLAALGICLVASLASAVLGHNAWGLAWQSAALTACAATVIVAALRLTEREGSDGAARVISEALVIAGGLSLILAAVQVFLPELADGLLVARPARVGRAVGNLRQPNHLSTLLLLSAAALAWLCTPGRSRAPWGALWGGVGLWAFTWGVVATGSRTGMVGVGLLTVWGLWGRSLPSGLRRALVSLPLAYAVWWGAMAAWAHWSGNEFIGESRLAAGGDISSSRFAIWANTLELIRMHPWTGVGWGNFNFAWTLTAFPGRPVAFFDHTHNLVLQLLVELGVPLGSVVLLLLGGAYAGLVRQALRPGTGPTPAMALYVVTLALFHSLLEYPLWYAYFLLPVAFLWALGLAVQVDSADPAGHRLPSKPMGSSTMLRVAGGVMMVGAVFAVFDYRRITEIYSPSRDNAAPLAVRIAKGQGSFFFSYQADYAAVTTATDPGDPAAYEDLRSTTHNLLDTRLMIAWAKAEAARGQTDKARYLAQRVLEFRNDASNEFFEPCERVGGEDEAPAGVHAPTAVEPFQCEADVPLRWQDFAWR